MMFIYDRRQGYYDAPDRRFCGPLQDPRDIQRQFDKEAQRADLPR